MGGGRSSAVTLSQSAGRKIVQLQEIQEGGLIQRWWVMLAGGGACNGVASRWLIIKKADRWVMTKPVQTKVGYLVCPGFFFLFVCFLEMGTGSKPMRLKERHGLCHLPETAPPLGLSSTSLDCMNPSSFLPSCPACTHLCCMGSASSSAILPAPLSWDQMPHWH